MTKKFADRHPSKYKKKDHCEKCGDKPEHAFLLEVDHKIPRSMGGSHDDSNLWTLCVTCHRLKTYNEDAPAIRNHKRAQKGLPVEEESMKDEYYGKRSIFSFRIPDRNLTRLRAYSKQKGITMSSLLNVHIESILAGHAVPDIADHAVETAATPLNRFSKAHSAPIIGRKTLL